MNSTYNNELTHHGITGQRWGVRRYQNPDGTRTAAGRAHRRELYDMSDLSDQEVQAKLNRARNELQYHQTMRKLDEEIRGSTESRERVQQAVKDLATVAAVTGSVVLIGTNGKKIVDAVLKTSKNAKVAKGK